MNVDNGSDLKVQLVVFDEKLASMRWLKNLTFPDSQVGPRHILPPRPH